MKCLFIALCLFISTNTLFAQEEIEIIEITEDKVPENIPFAIIEKVPVYPGCTGEDNEKLKKCMAENISAFVNTNFNVKKASRGLAPGIHRIFISFKIDKKGNITNIRSRAPNKKIEKEAIKMMKKLPKMIPGQQKGKNVGVLYSLPITFKLDK
jgi:hypothetical protein